MIAFLLALALSQAKPVISPSKPTGLSPGDVTHFTANIPVKWSLSPGSPGKIDEDGTYRAPSHLPVHNQLAGCQLLPNDHILNTRIDSLPLNPKSMEWLGILPRNALNYYQSWGTNVATSATPKQKVHFLYSEQNDGIFEIPAWPQLQRESGVFTSPRSEVDRHVITVDRESCKVFELYNNYTPGVNPQCPTCTAQGGVAYSGMGYDLPSAASDAAGLFIAPLSLHLSEIQAGQIQHALRFTLANSYVAPTSVWPSRAHANAWGRVPYGTRFRLRSDYDISRFSNIAKILLKQLKEYGLILADGGSNWQIETTTDVTLDPDVEAAFHELERQGPRGNDMQAVDESGLMISETSGKINPQNLDLADHTQATIIAADVNNPENRTSLRIPLQGITIGVPHPSLWIQSGVKTQLQAWVNGVANKALTWSMSPSLGTLSASGEYSAPPIDRPTIISLTAASAADPDAKAQVAVTVLPPGPIRVDVGNATQAKGAPNGHAPDYGPDSEGHMWWRDMAGEVSWGVVNDNWADWDRPKPKDVGLYYTSRYSFGDMIYRFVVPNGNYKVNLYFARPGCKGEFPKQQIGPIHIETQGRIILHDFNPGVAMNFVCNVPTVESIPATVTDGSLYFALRRLTFPNSLPSPLFNAYSIVPDDSGPRLAIDPLSPPDVVAGDQLHLYSVGWFMSSDATWSLDGPGTIANDGMYTAPVVPPPADRIVTVHAASKSDPAKSATVKLTLKTSPLEISPASATIVRSLSQKFKLSFGDATYSNVDWSLNPNLGTVDEEGIYSAPDTLASDTKVVITARSKDLPDRIATATINLKVTPDVIRVRCGEGPAFTDVKGNVWAADYGFSKDTVKYRNAVPIARATPDMQGLYQSSRYRYVDEPFAYSFAVPNGRYAVTLKFADYTYDEAGHYSFEVKLNGKRVLKNFDPDAEFGPKTAVDKTFETQVTHKAIRLDFIASVGAAFINGIEIRYLGQ